MKNLLKMATAIAMTGWLCSCSGEKTAANYQVIPIPQEIVMAANGEFALNNNVKIIYPEGNEAMQRNAQYLAGYLKKATGKVYQIETGTEGKGNILLQVVSDVEKPEAYQLKVNAEGVVISGASEAGVFYGIQTLRKSIPVLENSTPVLSYVEISDAPRFDYRGAHFDVSRHFFTVEEVKSFIDMMALHNMNRLHWHITDDQGWRIEIKKYPLLTKKGTTRRTSQLFLKEFAPDAMPADEKYGEGMYYSQEDMREIVAYAAERHIEVVPEIDMPGHMVAAIACYPELSCAEEAAEVSCRYGVMENILCCGKDQVYQFAKDIIDELCEIFTGRFFHIGGDEVPKARWKTCPRCQKR